MFAYNLSSACRNLHFPVTLLLRRKVPNVFFLLQIAFTFLVYPALILAYMGQAAYLSMHHEDSYQISFYVSVPGTYLIFWYFRNQNRVPYVIWS